MKHLILTVILLTFALATRAQDFIDNALLFSRTGVGGSARVQGIGGTQVSLGGDYSSAYANPAGLGMFNRSEFTFTPGMRFANSSSDYFGTSTKDSKNNFFIPGASLVLYTPSQKEEGFLGGSFAVTLNRINDFNQNYSFSGVNENSSIVHSFLDDANGVYFDNEIYDPEYLGYGDGFYTLTGLAFNNYLIDTLRDDLGGLYYDSPITVYWDENGEIASVRQTEISERKGAQNQWSIAYGANFSDKFFVGASIGITSLNYKLRQIYRETDFIYSSEAVPLNWPPLNSLEIEENYNIEGTGVNFNLGFIMRPSDNIQLGASFSTPTIYALTDSYQASMTTLWNNFDYYGDGTLTLRERNQMFDEPVVSEYSFRTPLKFSGGFTYIRKSGFISADIEFLNYRNARYKSDDIDFSTDNDFIKSEYKSVVNYRLGGEYRLNEWRFRGGAGFMSDPYQRGEFSQQQSNFSAGVGYRKKTFYVDLALVYSTVKGSRIPYFATQFSPHAEQKFTSTTAMVTVGFPF